MDTDYIALKNEATALENLIEEQFHTIQMVKCKLRTDVRSLTEELDLLIELNREVIVLRQLQEERLVRESSLRRIEFNTGFNGS